MDEKSPNKSWELLIPTNRCHPLTNNQTLLLRPSGENVEDKAQIKKILDLLQKSVFTLLPALSPAQASQENAAALKYASQGTAAGAFMQEVYYGYAKSRGAKVFILGYDNTTIRRQTFKRKIS